MRCTVRLLPIVAFALLARAELTAQVQLLSPGDVVRVELRRDAAPHPTLIEGTLLRMDGDTLHVNGVDGGSYSFTRGSVEGIRVQRGRRWGVGALVGFGAGVGTIQLLSCAHPFGGGCGGEDPGWYLLGGLLGAVVVGLPVGAMIPAWKDVDVTSASATAEPRRPGMPPASIVGLGLLAVGLGSIAYDSSLSDDGVPRMLIIGGGALTLLGFSMNSGRSEAAVAPAVGAGPDGLTLGIDFRARLGPGGA